MPTSSATTRQSEREAEGHHLAARFVTLFPEGASPAHTATVGPKPGPSSEPRRRCLPVPSVEVDHHGGVVGGTLARPLVAVDERVGDP